MGASSKVILSEALSGVHNGLHVDRRAPNPKNRAARADLRYPNQSSRPGCSRSKRASRWRSWAASYNPQPAEERQVHVRGNAARRGIAERGVSSSASRAFALNSAFAQQRSAAQAAQEAEAGCRDRSGASAARTLEHTPDADALKVFDLVRRLRSRRPRNGTLQHCLACCYWGQGIKRNRI